jgi:hypothetical protein
MPTPRSRQAARLRARRRRAQQRARLFVLLAALAVLGIVTLLLTAFGSSSPSPVATPSPVPTTPIGTQRPQPEVLATVGNLRLQLPVADSAVTAIGFHGARDGALELDPVGRQANEGLLLRLWHRITGEPTEGPVWYQLGGAAGPGSHVLDIGAAAGTDVYTPVDGTVTGIADEVLDDTVVGSRIDIRPTQAPAVVVSLRNLRPDPALSVGSPVIALRSKIGSLVDIAQVERQALAAHARDGGNNVSISVYPAAGSLP